MCRRFERPNSGCIKSRPTVMEPEAGGRFSFRNQQDMITDSEQRIAEHPKA